MFQEGYSLTGTSKNEKVTTLTNTHTPELLPSTGTKTWKDADNRDGKRPESITANLCRNELSLRARASADEWKRATAQTFQICANGQEITYTVTEDAVYFYTTESDGYNFINTHQPETTEITWNQDLERCKQPGCASGKHHCNPSANGRENSPGRTGRPEAGN